MTNDQIDWRDPANNSQLVDPERIAMSKRLDELSIDEAITYRPMDFFPANDEKRSYILSARVDGNFRRALRLITKSHLRTVRSNNQFICVALGGLILYKRFDSDITAIRSKFNLIVEGEDNFLYDRADRHVSLPQSSPLKQIKIGFTMREQDSFVDLAEELGLSVSSLIVTCLWLGATTSTHLPKQMMDSGNEIIANFERHLKSRLHDLNFTA